MYELCLMLIFFVLLVYSFFGKDWMDIGFHYL